MDLPLPGSNPLALLCQQEPRASFVQCLLCSFTYCRKHETITSSEFQTNSDLRMEAIFISLGQFLNAMIYRGYFGRVEKRTQTSVCGVTASVVTPRRGAFPTNSVIIWSILNKKGELSLFFLTFPALDSMGVIQTYCSIQVTAWICCMKRQQNCEQNKNDTERTLPDLHFYLLWALMDNQITNIIF